MKGVYLQVAYGDILRSLGPIGWPEFVQREFIPGLQAVAINTRSLI